MLSPKSLGVLPISPSLANTPTLTWTTLFLYALYHEPCAYSMEIGRYMYISYVPSSILVFSGYGVGNPAGSGLDGDCHLRAHMLRIYQCSWEVGGSR